MIRSLRPTTFGFLTALLVGAISAPMDAASQSVPAFNESEVDILQRLADRRAVIERMEATLDEREASLAADEGRVNGKIAQVGDLRCEIAVLIRQLREMEEERRQSIVKLYESMKPRDAARIFNAMEPPLALEIAYEMQPRKLSDMMQRMQPRAAGDLTRMIAERRAQGEAERQAQGVVLPEGCGNV